MTKITQASKVFESNIRLQMVASLSEGDLTYRQLKEICACSDGNMATHTKKLIERGYVEVKKEFVHNKPQTTYILTAFGREEYISYLTICKELYDKVIENEETTLDMSLSNG